jgi:SAM-dependent methyltransferase
MPAATNSPGSPIDAHVPTVAHYDCTYLSRGRVYSLATQLDAALALGPRSLLEVGVGTGITAFALRRVGIDVTTLDVQADLSPDLTGDVRKIPCGDASFDVSCCCQVLEHLPLADMPAALRELRRVTRWRLVLSLPDLTRFFGLSATLPFLGRRDLGVSLPIREPDDAWKAARLDTMGHYWEIGMNGGTSRGVLDALRRAGFDRVRTFRVPEIRWHRFFIADIA